MNEPTPEEAAAALHAVREGRELVIKSAAGSRWLWVVCGLVVFLYSAANDLFPATGRWLTWALLAVCLLLVFGTRTRVGGTLLGRQVSVSDRSLPLTFTTRLLRIVPVLGLGIVVSLIVLLLHLPHGQIYYGALAGLYIIFLGPRFQLWLLRRQDKD
ncbi:MAG TPA: hypothetical protein VG247_24880 [Pseudonocardiaceae bacterium]|nr:hypothetical protein [Pseudonocardiaceae bacterium]